MGTSEREMAMQPFTVSFKLGIPDGDAPIPIVIRVAKDDDEPNAFVSRRGGHVRLTRQQAHEADRYLNMTEEERTADRRFYEATALLKRAKTAKSIESWSDPVFSEDGEFYLDLDNLFDITAGADDDEVSARPAFVYASETQSIDFDMVEHLIEYLADESFEDAADQLVDLEGLRAFVEGWMKRQTLHWWREVREILIVDQEKFDARLAEAREIVKRGRPNLVAPDPSYGKVEG